MRRVTVACLSVLLLLLGAVRVKTMGYSAFALWLLKPRWMLQGAVTTDGMCFPGTDWHHDDCPGRVAMIWGRGDVGKPIDTEWAIVILETGIDPTEGAALWRQIEELYRGTKLVVSSSSLDWMDNWYAMYRQTYRRMPRLDAVGHRCHGGGIVECKEKVKAVTDWALRKRVPGVWVISFCSDGEDATCFMREMVEYYYRDPMIRRWAFGPACNTSLVDFEGGWMTPFGELYGSLFRTP